ncbi:MAG TPA: hypothetical protein VGO50_20805 [Pyrinomonadaceae bacterium]|jgi:hypothetical protein|nr:hypothetical protein [Pyrinomonadaceae bacterium]
MYVRLNNRRTFSKRIPLFCLLLLTLAGGNFAQGKIDGYKVYNAKVSVISAQDDVPPNIKNDFDSLVKIGKPQNFTLTTAGASFELPLSVNIFKSGGRIERVSFENVQVNGLKMQVEDFIEVFDFEKGLDMPFPRPLKVKVRLSDTARSLFSLKPSIRNFEVAGKVLVFGTFKKLGFKFKRAIPVDLKFKVKFEMPFSGVN